MGQIHFYSYLDPVNVRMKTEVLQSSNLIYQ